jgi:hypothetical protein
MDWQKAGALASIGSFVLAGFLALQPHLPHARSVVQPMTDWGPSFLLAASLVLAGMLHLKAAQVAQAKPKAQERQPAGAIRPSPFLDSPTFAGTVEVLPSPEQDDRVFVQKGPADLVARLIGQTDYTGQKLVSDYLGKWVHWLLPLYNISEIETYPWASGIISGGNAQLFIMVTMRFARTERDRVMHLEKGTVVEITGRIESLYKGEVTLGDCRLLGLRPVS